MDFRTTLQQLVRTFDANAVEYALTGGYAVGLWDFELFEMRELFLELRGKYASQ